MIPYENYQLNSKQIERISRMKARERIQKYIRDYGHSPSQEMISTFGAITANELEHYRQIYYSRNSEKENVGITATVEGWAEKTQKTYDEFIRLTYNITKKNEPTQLFKQISNIGYLELDGEEIDVKSLSKLGSSSDPWYGYTFNTIGVHTINLLLKSYSLAGQTLLQGAEALREITLPSCITDVMGTFHGCYGLSQIICYAETPPSIRIETNWVVYTFKGLRDGGTLYVPKGSLNAYMETWMKPQGEMEETLAGHNWTIKPIPE